MLSKNPEARPTMDEVYCALINKEYNPDTATDSPDLDIPSELLKLNTVWKLLPENLNDYTEESVKALTKVCEDARKQIYNCAVTMYDALRNLEKRKPDLKADYSKIKLIMSKIPKNLNVYTTESVENLKKIPLCSRNQRTSFEIPSQ